MSSELYKELIKSLKDDTLYDFLANNKWRLTNEDATQIAMEILWTYSEAIKNDVSLKKANEELEMNLKEQFGD